VIAKIHIVTRGITYVSGAQKAILFKGLFCNWRYRYGVS